MNGRTNQKASAARDDTAFWQELRRAANKDPDGFWKVVSGALAAAQDDPALSQQTRRAIKSGEGVIKARLAHEERQSAA